MPSLVVTAPGNLTEEEQAICEVFFTLPYSTPLNLTGKMYENSLRLWWVFGRQYVKGRYVQVLGTGPFFQWF